MPFQISADLGDRQHDHALQGVDPGAILEEAIGLGDDAFLQWLARQLERRVPEESWLVEDVLARKPLHRVLSLRQGSEEGSPGDPSESRLYKWLAATSRDPTGQALTHAEVAFREALGEIATSKAQPAVVLVDFPGLKQANAGDVRLLHRPSGALIGPGPLWKAIQQNFRVWVAKARVFIKPGVDLSRAERQAVIRRTLELVRVARSNSRPPAPGSR